MKSRMKASLLSLGQHQWRLHGRLHAALPPPNTPDFVGDNDGHPPRASRPAGLDDVGVSDACGARSST